MNSGRQYLILLTSIILSICSKGQTYEHLIIQSGFNHDVIANGAGPAVNSTSAGIDSTGLTWANCLMSQDFQPTAAPPPAYALPINGLINSITTTALSFQLGSYNASNSLWLNYQNSGTLTFTNQLAASRLYILMTSGHNVSTANGVIHFTDNTTQNFGVINCPDWFNGTNPPATIQGIGRVFRATNVIDNPFQNPRLYQYSVNIAAANIQKQIASVQFNKTNQTAVLNIFAVTAQLSPCPILDLFGDNFELCPGVDTTMTPEVANAITYNWNDGSQNPTLTIDSPGTYWVTIQTAQCTYSDTISVTLPYLVSPFSIGPDLVLCADESVMLESDVVQAGSYLWSNGSTSTTTSVSGENLFWLQVSDGCGSYRDSLNTSIQLGPQPFSLGADISFCQGDTHELITDPQTDMNYLWQNGSSQNSLVISNAGTYWLRIFNNCGMVGDTVVVSIPASPIAILPMDTTLCDNATLSLNPMLSNNSGQFWQNNSTSPSFTVIQSGIYTVSAYNQCDTVSDEITVTYVNAPSVQLGPDLTACEGETVTLTAYGNNNDYIWLDGSFGSNYEVTNSGIYWAMAANYCGITYDTLEVRYTLLPRLDFGDDQMLCLGEEVLLSGLNERANYLWNDGLTEPVRLINTEGEYSLRAYNQCGEASDAISIDYLDCSCVIFIPNTFTPDNDGINDFFMPKFSCDFENYNLKIFNSWGQMIFESHEPGFPWDGSYLQGEYYVNSGVFSYSLTYKLPNEVEPIRKRGSVNMLR